MIRWGVLGARSRIHRQRLRPAFGLAGHRIVAEGSRRGADTSEYAAVVDDPDVDAVYVPLPNGLHIEWVTRALSAGKHVLCEKPLTMGASTTRELYAAAEAAGRHLSEAYMWPHHPRAVQLLRLIADGELGRLLSHHATFTYGLERDDDHRLGVLGGGVLLDVGIYCLGPPLLMSGASTGTGGVAASAVRNDAGVDTAMTGWVELEPGTAATFAVCCTAPPRRHQEVIGTNGTVVIDNHVPGPDRAGAITIVRPDGSRDEVPYAGANAYERMITAFAAEAAGDVEPVWPPARSIRLAHLLDTLQAAAGAGR